MTRFNYKVMDTSGRTYEGTFDGVGEQELEAYFLKNDLTPLSVKVQKGKGTQTRLPVFFSRSLVDTEVIAFTRQFAAAYGAGLPVASTLDLLAAQSGLPPFREALVKISNQIKAGSNLTRAFGGNPQYFDETYLACLGAGEATGNLDTVLAYAASLLEKRYAYREKLKATFLYPKLVFAMIALTALVILLFVIPQFAKLYNRFGAKLPLPTRLLIAIGNGVHAYWWLLPLAIPVFFYMRAVARKNRAIVLWWHRQQLAVPLFGPTGLKAEMGHFCTTFSLLLRSGIKITEATEIAIKSLRNRFLQSRLEAVGPALESGGTLAGALEKASVTPPLMISMIRLGEEAGKLDELLERVAALYENETDMMLKKIPTLLEPVILGVLFVLVLLLALAVYLPLWRMSALIHH